MILNRARTERCFLARSIDISSSTPSRYGDQYQNLRLNLAVDRKTSQIATNPSRTWAAHI